jgi:hypothetical protein
MKMRVELARVVGLMNGNDRVIGVVKRTDSVRELRIVEKLCLARVVEMALFLVTDFFDCFSHAPSIFPEMIGLADVVVICLLDDLRVWRVNNVRFWVTCGPVFVQDDICRLHGKQHQSSVTVSCPPFVYSQCHEIWSEHDHGDQAQVVVFEKGPCLMRQDVLLALDLVVAQNEGGPGLQVSTGLRAVVCGDLFQP